MSKSLLDAAADGSMRRSRWSATWHLVLEFVLLFGATMLLKQILAATVNASYPSPLWLPVMVLALQRGFAAGLAAAIIASASSSRRRAISSARVRRSPASTRLPIRNAA